MRTVYAIGAVLLLAGSAWAVGADGDGKVSRAELTAVHASLFDQLDTNKDGVVDLSDGDAHFLEIADYNHDGRVTREENNTYAAEAAAADLANCDADKDDALSGDEMKCITSADSAE
jgi:hypothetical protein